MKKGDYIRDLTRETLTREEKPKLTIQVPSVVSVIAPSSHQLSDCMFV